MIQRAEDDVEVKWLSLQDVLDLRGRNSWLCGQREDDILFDSGDVVEGSGLEDGNGARRLDETKVKPQDEKTY